MQTATFTRERELLESGFLPIGIDEAGRGPLAGPVVAAAVLIKHEAWNIKHEAWSMKHEDTSPRFKLQDSSFKIEEDKRWKLVRDSKKLSPKQRENAFAFVQEHFFVGVGIISSETIDRVNILQATFLAMRSAISELRRMMNQELGSKQEEKIVLLVDGNQEIPNLSLKQETIVDGDGLVKSIAAASIAAKVTRDRLMQELDRRYPQYGFARHKGYGTREHMDALRRHGPTSEHRLSFAPVKLSIPENVNRKIASLAKRGRGW